MSTERSNIQVVADIAGELSKPIETNSLAYQVCGVQYSSSTAPLVFGLKKGTTTISVQIVKKTPENTFRSISDTDGFTEEAIDDMFAIFGEDALEYLKLIAANNLADALDVVVVDHMYDISSKVGSVTYDFGTMTDHRQIIQNLLLKINKERVVMANTLKRGLPKVLIVSPNVSALLITNKMISGSNSDMTVAGKDNIKFAGFMGDMSVYIDFTATSEYVMISHKTYLPGDASMILIPIKNPKAAIIRDKESGQPQIHFSHKYAYSRNPLDTEAIEYNLTDAIFTNGDNSINSVLTDFSAIFVAGDNIRIKDANTEANDGLYLVDTVTANKIIVTGGTITTDTTNTAVLEKDNSDFITSFPLTLTGFSSI